MRFRLSTMPAPTVCFIDHLQRFRLMANPMDAPDHIRIAALEQKKGLAQLDLMRPGPGTPWEGRGGGFVSSFLKTCLMSIFIPARLLDNIRRPENAQDSN